MATSQLRGPFTTVQRGVWGLLAAALALLVLVQSPPGYAGLVAARDELVDFRRHFRQRTAEGMLQQQAAAAGQVSFTLETQVRDQPGQNAEAPQTARVRALSSVTLQTLRQIFAHAQPNMTVTIGALDAEALASSLRWRLTRAEYEVPPVLDGVELFWADVTAADADLERRVAELYDASVDAREQAQGAKRTVRSFSRRASDKKGAKLKSRVALDLRSRTGSVAPVRWAHARMKQTVKSGQEAQQRFVEAARRAERPHRLSVGAGDAAVAIARVSLIYGSQRRTMDVPVPLQRRDVAVTPLQGATFPATRAAALWPAVEGGSATAALAIVQRRMPWHSRAWSIFGVTLNGTGLLRFLPCLLLVGLGLLWLRVKRIAREAAGALTQIPATTPSRYRGVVDFVALVALPLAAVAKAAVVLTDYDLVPLGLVVVGAACAVLGVVAFRQLQLVRGLFPSNDGSA